MGGFSTNLWSYEGDNKEFRGKSVQMARLAYILLCHRDPEGIIAQARRLIAGGDYVAIHVDANAPDAVFDRVEAALSGDENVAFARRVRCGWGEWSLVRATLNAVELADRTFPKATHFYMVSGDCMPIKSARYVHDFLDAEDRDYIESFDFHTSGWIKTGMQDERLIYRHFVNERKHKWWFYTLLELQKRLGLKRAIPNDLEVMIGSQWWCLRRRTIEAVLDFVKARGDVVRFFRTTWIPDETFFQTLVRHLVPEAEIVSRSLTFLMFSDYGMPVTFYNDQYDLLLAQDFLFARKISPEAQGLKGRLGDLYASDQDRFAVSGEGVRLHRYLVGQGRIGRRYAPRFWMTGSSVGRDRVLFLLVCKKWHVAKRLVDLIRAETGQAGLGYFFDENGDDLPDLGGIENALEKRTRHRRAVMRMVFEHFATDRLVVCLDPANLAVIEDFAKDMCETRVLEIDCRYDEAYFVGHARRVGLAGPEAGAQALARLVPTLRRQFEAEAAALRDAGLGHLFRIREDNDAQQNADQLARFLGLDAATALRIIAADELFAE